MIKKKLGTFYQKELSFLNDFGFSLPDESSDFAENICWVFGLIAPSEAEKENLVAFLNQNKIATRPFFWCMHEQPVFKEMGLFQNESYPNAEKLARNG